MNVFIVKGYRQYDGEVTIGIRFDEVAARKLLDEAWEKQISFQEEWDCEIWDERGFIGHFDRGQEIQWRTEPWTPPEKVET